MTTPDETWTVGEAARYLNAGGIDFGIEPRKVRRWVNNPACQIAAVQPATGQWRQVLASTVRAERARLLAAAGRQDPDWPVVQLGGTVGDGDPPDRD
jgi:hypothetical protein